MYGLNATRVRLRGKKRRPTEAFDSTSRGLERLPAIADPLFVDAGAHIGFFSFLFAQHGFRVLAFEPMASNRAAFRATCCLNRALCKRIRLLPYALGAHESESCILRSSPDNVGNAKLKCGGTYKTGSCAASHTGVCERANSTTLDAYFNITNASIVPAIVKIDVEGRECLLLQGAGRFLSLHNPLVIQVESNNAQSTACIKRIAATRGYGMQAGIMAQSPDHVLFLHKRPW